MTWLSSCHVHSYCQLRHVWLATRNALEQHSRNSYRTHQQARTNPTRQNERIKTDWVNKNNELIFLTRQRQPTSKLLIIIHKTIAILWFGFIQPSIIPLLDCLIAGVKKHNSKRSNQVAFITKQETRTMNPSTANVSTRELRPPFEDDDAEFEPLPSIDDDTDYSDFVLLRADSDSSSEDESTTSSEEEEEEASLQGSLLVTKEEEEDRLGACTTSASNDVLVRQSNSSSKKGRLVLASLVATLVALWWNSTTMQPPSLRLAQQLALKLASQQQASGSSTSSIYIPGLGFSGFWFTLGRLKSHSLASLQKASSENHEDLTSKSTNHTIHVAYNKSFFTIHPQQDSHIRDNTHDNTNYVCFSAGCLGSVAILMDIPMQEMACMAQAAQTAWKTGQVQSHYEVVPLFVQGMVYRNFSLAECRVEPTETTTLENPQDWLSQLHILTTTKSPSSLLPHAVMRTPSTLDELYDMLIQTTWIPFATGKGWSHQGHFDGGFSLWQHPILQSDTVVTLPSPLHNLKLWLQSLNVNMGVEQAYQFWNEGLEYGL